MNKRFSEGELKSIRHSAFINDRIEPVMATHVMNLVDQLLEEGPIENKFTEEEKKAIELSGELWNAFVALPVQHPSDQMDFCNAIHTIQRILGWRPMMRKGHLDVWRSESEIQGSASGLPPGSPG